MMSNVCCPCALEYVWFQRSTIHSPWATLLKKNNYLCPMHSQLPITPQLIMEIHVHLPLSFFPLDLGCTVLVHAATILRVHTSDCT